MSFKSVFFKPIKDDVRLPEDVIEKVEEVDKVVAGEEQVEVAPVVAETVEEKVEEVPAVETVEEAKEVVEEQIEAKDDLTGGVATLSEPDEDGFQELLAPEGYEGEEVFEEKEVEEPVIADQLNVVEKEPVVEEPVTEVAESEYFEEKEEDHIVAVTEEKDMVEVEVDDELSNRIHKIIETHTADATKEILELIKNAINGK